MLFDELNETIPYVIGKKTHVLTMSPYPGIELAMPGKHQKDTPIIGADFVVRVTHGKWVKHQFTHTDIFKDIQGKALSSVVPVTLLMKDYLKVVLGGDPDDGADSYAPGIPARLLLHAMQCLAVAEHRRYGVHEKAPKFGGRFLPFRFAAGIAEGLWGATDAIEKQRMGRGGVVWLEKDHGVPLLTQELFNNG